MGQQERKIPSEAEMLDVLSVYGIKFRHEIVVHYPIDHFDPESGTEPLTVFEAYQRLERRQRVLQRVSGIEF